MGTVGMELPPEHLEKLLKSVCIISHGCGLLHVCGMPHAADMQLAARPIVALPVTRSCCLAVCRRQYNCHRSGHLSRAPGPTEKTHVGAAGPHTAGLGGNGRPSEWPCRMAQVIRCYPSTQPGLAPDHDMCHAASRRTTQAQYPSSD